MTLQIALLLGIVGCALIFFWREWFPPDVVAIGVALAAVFAGCLPASKAFAGFGSDTVIMILGLLILTAALQRTGVVDLAGRAVMRHAGDDPNRLLWIVMLTSATLGAFMSNTASTAFFLPVVFGIARKAGVSVSKLLLPLAFSSILTSSVTLVSTSTNMVVSGMLSDYGLMPMGMFELAPVGVPIAVVGLAYLFLARRLIPDRTPPGDLTEEFGVRPYLSEIVVLSDSPLIDQTLAEARFGQELGLTVLRIIRGDDHLQPRPASKLREGDVLIVEGSQEDIVKIKDTAGVEIKADVKLSDPDLTGEETALVEAILLPGSPLIGRTLRMGHFRERYGPQVIGINHHGRNVVDALSDTRLGLGDVLLLQGRRSDIARIHDSGVVSIVGPAESMSEKRPRRERAPLAIALFVGVIALATFKILTLPLAVMLGVLLVFATRCITPEEAYGAVEWKSVILIGSMLSLGAAMEHTGAAKYLAGELVALTGSGNPIWLLTVFFVLTVALTQPMSNQAAAIVVLPVAIQTALSAGLNPRTFAMMVAVAASCSYLTPLEPACVMVQGPGRFKFTDFLRVGALLTLLIYAVAIVLVPRVWPLH